MLLYLSIALPALASSLWSAPLGDKVAGMQQQAALVEAFPHCTELSQDPARGITSFQPHLSLGQWHSRAHVLQAQQVQR